MKSIILSVILAIIITGPINAQKISEFRPENHTGVSAEKGLLKAGPFWAHPIIHNGILYLRHSNALMAYDIKAK